MGITHFLVAKLSSKLLLNDQTLLSTQQTSILAHPNSEEFKFPFFQVGIPTQSTGAHCQAFSECGEDKPLPLPLCSPLNILSEHRFPTPNMSQVEGELWKELEHKKYKRKYFCQDFCTHLGSHLLTKPVNIHHWLVKLGMCNIAGLLPGLNYSSSL